MAQRPIAGRRLGRRQRRKMRDCGEHDDDAGGEMKESRRGSSLHQQNRSPRCGPARSGCGSPPPPANAKSRTKQGLATIRRSPLARQLAPPQPARCTLRPTWPEGRVRTGCLSRGGFDQTGGGRASGRAEANAVGRGRRLVKTSAQRHVSATVMSGAGHAQRFSGRQANLVGIISGALSRP